MKITQEMRQYQIKYKKCYICDNECSIVGDISSKGEVKEFCCNCWKKYNDPTFFFKCDKCKEILQKERKVN